MARALTDPASQATYISPKVQRKLSLSTISSAMEEMSGLNDSLMATASKICFIAIRSETNPDIRLQCEAYVVEKLTGRLPTCLIVNII